MGSTRTWHHLVILVTLTTLAYGQPGYSTDIECYERVAVGKKINETEVTSTVPVGTVRHCEQECERSRCHAYSFGISATGNGTCNLAAKMPTLDPVNDIDYDLFYKNMACMQRKSCYKRMAIGRSLIDRLIKRSLLCDSLRACEEACLHEKVFQCNGFNFKYDKTGTDNKCQLTDATSLDLTSHFNPDVDFDFYDRDLNGPRQCFTGPGYPAFGPGYHGGGRPPGGRPPIHEGGPPPGPPGGYDRPPGVGGYGPGIGPPARPGGPPPDYRPGYPGDDCDNFRPCGPHGGGGGPHGGGGGPHGVGGGPHGGGGGPHGGGGGPHGGGGGYPGDNALGPPLYPPSDNRHEYGGGAYGLGSGGGLPDECFLRSRTGFKLDRRVVLVSLSVPSLYDCESICVNERKFKCNVFSFRYSVSPSVPSHNCHVGEKPYTELDTYQDIVPDRDYDIYERNPTGRQGCQPKRHWGSECFERVRSGLKLKPNMVKFAMKCTSLKDCESACLNIPQFTCRAFSYRYGPPVIGEGEANCLLTDWPIPEMNAQKHLSEDPECELYHRGSYGHGCEIDRPLFRGQPPLPPPGGAVGRPLPPPPTDDGYGPGNEIPSTYLPPDKRPQEYYPHKPQGYLPPPRPVPGYLPPEKPQGYLPPPPGQRPPYQSGEPYPPQKYYPSKQDGGGYLPPPKDGYHPPRKPDAYLPPKKPDYPYKPDNYPSPPHNGYLPPQKPQYGDYPGGQGEGYRPGFGRRPGETYLPPGNYGASGGRPRPSDQCEC